MTVINDLLEYQIGKELTWGTAVVPTAKLMGIEEFQLVPVNEAVVHGEQRGALAPGYETNLTVISGRANGRGLLLYEDLPYWLDSLCGEATPSGVGPYTYAYAAPSATVPSPRILTLVKGDAGDVYGLEGGLVNQLVISGRTGEALKWSGDLIGENVLTDVLMALSDRTVNVAMADHVALYIDAWGGTMGATAITTAFFDFALTLNANRAVYHGLGALTPKGYREAKWAGQLSLKLELDATSKAFLDAIIGGSAVFQKQVRIKASSGASLDAEFDFAGTSIDAPEVFTDEDGVTSLEVVLDGTYNSALGNWFKAEVINGVATLP